MDAAAIDADPMLRLLTEALRRGPGSPEWHKCVSDLKARGGADADEYQLLLTARERLESGRAYRQVRAGPAFTRDLFGRLDARPATRRFPVATLVRLGCLLLGVLAVGLLVSWVSQATPTRASALTGRLFLTPLANFDLRDGVPRGLTLSGAQAGRRIVKGPTGLRLRDSGGPYPETETLVLDDVQDVRRGLCLECRVNVQPGPAAIGLAARIRPKTTDFAAEDFVPDVFVQYDRQGVVAGTPAAAGEPRPLTPGPHVLRLKIADGLAAADVDGQVVWTGSVRPGDSAQAALTFGRFAKGSSSLAAESLRVLAP